MTNPRMTQNEERMRPVDWIDYPQKPCEHCFCKTCDSNGNEYGSDLLKLDHIKCCMCGTRGRRD